MCVEANEGKRGGPREGFISPLDSILATAGRLWGVLLISRCCMSVRLCTNLCVVLNHCPFCFCVDINTDIVVMKHNGAFIHSLIKGSLSGLIPLAPLPSGSSSPHSMTEAPGAGITMQRDAHSHLSPSPLQRGMHGGSMQRMYVNIGPDDRVIVRQK